MDTIRDFTPWYHHARKAGSLQLPVNSLVKAGSSLNSLHSAWSCLLNAPAIFIFIETAFTSSETCELIYVSIFGTVSEILLIREFGLSEIVPKIVK